MFQFQTLKYVVVLFTGLAIAVSSGDTLLAQKKEESAAKESKAEAKPARKKAKGRVPAHYGKLNLTQEQKDKIYAIQANYKSQIDSLKKQLEELNAKKNKECETVLTADQKQDLVKFVAAAASKRKAKSKN